MNVNDVIDAYVIDVMHRLPARERNEIGLELRGLLAEMLVERADGVGRAADDAMVLAMLRDFGTPAEVAARYRPPGLVAIPPQETGRFALIAIVGLVFQWAISLPYVFDGRLSLAGWWLGPGLGAFWWPGFMIMFTLLAAWLRQRGWFKPRWRPRAVDPERVNRGALAFGLAWFVIGVAVVVSLPWLVPHLPGALPRVLALDPDFLRIRAWPVLPLWTASFAILACVLVQGRWSPLMRKLEIVSSAAFIALLLWWVTAGRMFQATPTDQGARGILALIVVIMLVDLGVRLQRGRTRIRLPDLSG
jgi:hypothetical protein